MSRISDLVNNSKRVFDLNKDFIEQRSVKRRVEIAKALPTDISYGQLKVYINDNFHNTCVISGSKNIEVDHFIPVSWGHGGNYIGNLIPLDIGLNKFKREMNPFEWAKKFKIDNDKFNEIVKYLSELNGLSPIDFKEFVYWCEKNKRDVKQIKEDDLMYSIDLWKESTNYPERKFIEFIVNLLKANKKQSIDIKTIKLLCKENRIQYYDLRDNEVREMLKKKKVIFNDQQYLKMKR